MKIFWRKDRVKPYIVGEKVTEVETFIFSMFVGVFQKNNPTPMVYPKFVQEHLNDFQVFYWFCTHQI